MGLYQAITEERKNEQDPGAQTLRLDGLHCRACPGVNLAMSRGRRKASLRAVCIRTCGAAYLGLTYPAMKLLPTNDPR